MIRQPTPNALRSTRFARSSRAGFATPSAGAFEAESDQQLLDQVHALASAQIVAEPGWIEDMRFAIEDVSLDIRRAGLDRDPEWVPWLGIVLRFIYG